MARDITEILKKAKAVDKRTKERFDDTGNKPQPKGYMEEMDGSALISMEEAVNRGLIDVNQMPQPSVSKKQKKLDVNSEQYVNQIQQSKLPDAVKKAMLENPIPQAELPSSLGGQSFELTEDMINEINPDTPVRRQKRVVEHYEEEDERTFPVESKSAGKRLTESYKKSDPKKAVINEEYLVRLIDSRLEKLLPEIVEEYFDKRVISEQIQVKVGNTIFSGNLKPLPKRK